MGYNNGSQLADCFKIDEKYFLHSSVIGKNIEYEYREPHFHFTEEVFNLPDNINITGYYQSENYFKGCPEKIRDFFVFKDWIEEEASNIFSEKNIDEESVCVHVRRGDYIQQSANHPALGKEYYNDAFRRFEGKNKVIFSDDFEWCTEEFKGLNDTIVINLEHPYVSLCLMSKFKKFVIANSSFSWWAAWLSKDKSSVIAPKNWFGPSLPHNTKDLYPLEWQII